LTENSYACAAFFDYKSKRFQKHQTLKQDYGVQEQPNVLEENIASNFRVKKDLRVFAGAFLDLLIEPEYGGHLFL
jgi:hypothetical protein